MSEYQYYEFQAVDRRLTPKEMETLRSYSSRATITPGRFVNDYSYGSFRGDPAEWMEKYFDAFLYLANWGTHELMLRLPLRLLPQEVAARYCVGSVASVRAVGEHLIVQVHSEQEGGGEWIEEEGDRLATLLPLRTELSHGDLRALYLTWLLAAQMDELEEDRTEPPVPNGLGNRSQALDALIDFLRIDRHLVEAAAAGDAPHRDDRQALRRWVSGLPEAQKASWLIRLAETDDPHLHSELLRHYRDAAPAGPRPRLRTVGELRALAAQRFEAAQTTEAHRREREAAEQVGKASEARERHLTALSRREEAAWREVEALIETKNPKRYDEAVALLRDLRDLATREGRQAQADTSIEHLRQKHLKKGTLLSRLAKARLIARQVVLRG